MTKSKIKRASVSQLEQSKKSLSHFIGRYEDMLKSAFGTQERSRISQTLSELMEERGDISKELAVRVMVKKAKKELKK